MSKIIILDGYTANPGDLSWESLKALGELTIYPRTSEEEIIPRATEAEILLTNKVPLSAETIAQLPRLKYIGVLATGYNVVDLEAASERGIPVTNIPEYSTSSVNQLVFSHLLNHCHQVSAHGAGVREGKWSASEDFCYWDSPLSELSGLTLGLIGLGKIGNMVARTALSFGMRVIAYTPSGKNREGVELEMTDLETLCAESDVISLHCPLTSENQGLINASLLAQLKPSAYLINTARGPLINEADLAEALNNGLISGAGLDVLSQEPPAPDNPLLTARNCTITPHIAWATKSARARLIQTASTNLQSFLNGEPVNVVN